MITLNKRHSTLLSVSSLPFAALPADGPKIKGGRPRYQLGETVRVNCTSGGFSRPPTKLTWFINGEPASPAFLREYEPIKNARGLVLTRLGLEFTARQRHFQKGDLKLKVGGAARAPGQRNVSVVIRFRFSSLSLPHISQCLATIATIYWRSNEESVSNERQQHQPPVPVPWEERATTVSVPSSGSVASYCSYCYRSSSNLVVLVLLINLLARVR